VVMARPRESGRGSGGVQLVGRRGDRVQGGGASRQQSPRDSANAANPAGARLVAVPQHSLAARLAAQPPRLGCVAAAAAAAAAAGRGAVSAPHPLGRGNCRASAARVSEGRWQKQGKTSRPWGKSRGQICRPAQPRAWPDGRGRKCAAASPHHTALDVGCVAPLHVALRHNHDTMDRSTPPRVALLHCISSWRCFIAPSLLMLGPSDVWTEHLFFSCADIPRLVICHGEIGISWK
jgi:hypothetical protein